MGEIADDMIEGRACSECGCYFADPEKDSIYEHGYPVLCWDCWEEGSKLQKAEVETL